MATAHFMLVFGCRRRVGLCTYTYTRARVRASGSARAFHRCLENKTRSVMFRKLNKGRDEKTVNGFSRSSVGFLLSYLTKRQTVAGSVFVYTYTHTRARWLRSFLAFVSFIGKKSFFFFSFFYIFSFFLFFILKRVIFFSFSLFLKKSKYK